MSKVKMPVQMILSALCVLALGAVSALAQSDRGTITGTARDSSGAVLVGVSITVTNEGTGLSSRTATGQTGTYTIPLLSAGTYTMTAELAGFKKHSLDGILVEVAQSHRVDLQLEVGEVTETVQITAEAPLLRPDTSDLGTVITNSQVLDLPLSMQGEARSPLSFISLVPGVVSRGVSSDRNFSTTINGGQSLSFEIQIEGATIQNTNISGDFRNVPFPQDAVQEFKLTTNNFAAEFGRTGGGITSFTVKSGTNNFRGSLFEFLRNDVLDARGFFARTRPVNRQNEFGGTFGGPIKKDRTFVFGYYDGFRFRRGPQNFQVSVPTEAYRRGDFSGLRDAQGNQIPVFDPQTTRSDGRGGFTRDQFPGNIIPQNRISRLSRDIAALFPNPTISGRDFDNFLAAKGSGTETNRWGTKVDHAFSDRNKLSVYFAWSRIEGDFPPGPFLRPLSTNNLTRQNERLVRINHDYFLRPNLVNHLSIGYNRNNFFFGTETAGEGWPGKLGLGGLDPSGPFPTLRFTNGFAGVGTSGLETDVENGFVYADNVTWIKGAHTLKFGIDFRRNGENVVDLRQTAGEFNFSFLETSLPNAANRGATGNGFASFLLGTVNSSVAQVHASNIGNRYSYYSFFAQDDFKVRPKLTLNYGLRYEIPIPRQEVVDRMSSFDPALPNPAAGGRLGALIFAGSGPGGSGRRSFADTDYMQFGPRVGFAYSFDSKTVLRGGYGIYYSTGGAVLDNGARAELTLGFNAFPTFASTDLGITPAFQWDQGFPQNFRRPPIIDPSFANGGSPRWLAARDGHVPYIQNWTLNLQRELPGSLLIDAAYAGSKGTRLSSRYNPNQLHPRFLSLGSLLTANINSAEARAASIPIPFPGFSGSVAQALRPYPQYLDIVRPFETLGHSTYHALQLKLNKRFSDGLNLLLSYTMSKTLTDSASQHAAFFSTAAQDSYNRQVEKAISENDVPHNLVLSYSYELPVGPGKRFAKGGGVSGKLLGGWQVNAIQIYQSGQPLAVTVNNTLPLFNGQLRPNIVPGQELRTAVSPGEFDPARDRYINANAFAIPAPFTFGNGSRRYSGLRGFTFLNEDIGITKRTLINERINVEFRVEVFNVFNRVVFGSPANNPSNAAQFGRVSSQANLPRQIQFGLKVNY